jgi:2,3-bisphosphoglycerate-independent phosphoglycerate mutase
VDLRDVAALAQPTGEKILLLVLDGIGGLPLEPGGLTELETARTPHMDGLLASGDAGLHVPVARGVTPGSGPGHLSLFGFDPLKYRVGRGALAALGVEFPLQPGDVAIRGNLCTVDGEGVITDRRAGRIPTEEAEPVLEILDGIRVQGAQTFVRPVKEHRFLLVLRPEESTEAVIEDTDPGMTGVPPLDVAASSPSSEVAAQVTREWLALVPETLASQPRANMVLLRGFATLPDWPRFPDVFRMRSLAIAAYPMYRGVARLVGMDAMAVDDDPASLLPALRDRIDDYDFFFLHVKGTDKAGEDGDFQKKVDIIERVDELLPDLLATGIGVTAITGDHSTPARMRGHSWHPVPFLLHGGPGRGHRSEGTAGFGESECARGSIGSIRGCELMPLAMARAGRLGKFGA